jgi:hypothetical protein
MRNRDNILDDLFHACALRAFVEVSRQCQGWPDSEATRRLAYSLYEEALAAKNQPKP